MVKDRANQVWITPGGEVWLITSSQEAGPDHRGKAQTRHNTVILDSPVRSIVGAPSWSHEVHENPYDGAGPAGKRWHRVA